MSLPLSEAPLPARANKPRSVAFLALGCRLNQAEESTYREHSLESGWKLVDFRQEADIYIVNTCAVTLEAERQSRQMIRQARRRNPQATVVVTGCAGRSLQGHPEMEGVADLYIPNLDKEQLVSQLRQFLGEELHPQFERPFPPWQNPVPPGSTSRWPMAVLSPAPFALFPPAGALCAVCQ